MMKVKEVEERRHEKLTPALEEYSQYDRPQEENEEDEEDFLIFDINLDSGVQQVGPREGSDLWNKNWTFLFVIVLVERFQ